MPGFETILREVDFPNITLREVDFPNIALKESKNRFFQGRVNLIYNFCSFHNIFKYLQ